jgi:hypothetical protein
MWYHHPDSMACAYASNNADILTNGAAHDTLAWKKAYRLVYSNESDYGTRSGRSSLDKYLRQLDDEIAAMEQATSDGSSGSA